MSDHLGDWFCRYCHYKAKSLYLWKKHLDNFHEGSDPRSVTHVEPAGEYRCWICTENNRSTYFTSVASFVAHLENHHYSMTATIPLAWSERIHSGVERWLAFHRYLKEAGRE